MGIRRTENQIQPNPAHLIPVPAVVVLMPGLSGCTGKAPEAMDGTSTPQHAVETAATAHAQICTLVCCDGQQSTVSARGVPQQS